MVLYDAVVTKGPENVDHGIRGYYFGENGEHSWYDISKAIGRAMVELGLSKTDEPDSFTDEELAKLFGSEVCGVSEVHFGIMGETDVLGRRWVVTTVQIPDAVLRIRGRWDGSQSTRKKIC